MKARIYYGETRFTKRNSPFVDPDQIQPATRGDHRFDLDQIGSCKLARNCRGNPGGIMQATPPPTIPGTTIFDGAQARKGYALNKMCFSFNDAVNRRAFCADEEAYMRHYRLSEQQADAIRRRDVPALLEAGGNVYYLAKFAGILGLDVQDLGALQTGMSKEAFKAMLVEHNRQPERLTA
jgi:protocatechuate 4,5-dioxygenase, alpha chain